MTPEMQMLWDIFENAYAWVFFGGFLLVGELVIVIVALFAALAVRKAWRWLRSHSWHDAIARLSYRAVRQR